MPPLKNYLRSNPDIVLRRHFATGIAAGGSDTSESDQALEFQILGNGNPLLFATQPAIDPSGKLTFQPAANAVGTAQLTVVLTDDGGTENGGMDTSVAQQFSIEIGGVNDPPVFGLRPDPFPVAEDAPLQTIPGFAFGMNPGPADEAGQSLTFEIVGNTNSDLFAEGPAISPSGDLTYRPAADAHGLTVARAAPYTFGGQE